MLTRLSIKTIAVAVLLLLIIISQFSFFGPVRDSLREVLAWPSRLASSVSDRVGSSVKILFSIGDLARENSDLRVENTKLTSELAKLKSVKAENDLLRVDLNFKETHQELNLLPAQVVSFSPSGLYQSLIISSGAKEGVKENQAVVSGGFLIGKIHAVSDETSEVWLLTNRNLLTPVVLTGSSTVGLLSGGIRGLVVENVPLDTKVTIGESVVTSTLESIYPAGIAIGQVEEVISLKEEIFLTLRIASPVSLGNLTTVFVVTGK